MKRKLWKIVAVLGVTAAINGNLGCLAASVVQNQDKQKEVSQSCQILETEAKKKTDPFFSQTTEDGGLVLWKWKKEKQQSRLVGIRKYWDRDGNVEKSTIKVKLSGKKKQIVNYNLSCMKESEEGDIYLLCEKKNGQKAAYITAQPDGTVKQSGIFDLKTLGNEKQYALDSMKIVQKDQIAVVYSAINSKKQKTKYHVLSMNTENGKISKTKTEITFDENKNQINKNQVNKNQINKNQVSEKSFLWNEDFLYLIQDFKILIINNKEQEKNIIEVPEQFQNFSVCMAGNRVFLFDLEKGIYYYDIKNSDKWNQLNFSVPDISGNYRTDTVIVTKNQDMMYIALLSGDEKEGKNKSESCVFIKYELGQTEEKLVQKIQLDYKEYDSAQELVDKADCIFTGTVKKVTYENIDSRTGTSPDPSTGLDETIQPFLMPYTIFEIEVSEVYKGKKEEKTIYIKQVGGIFDSMVYELEGASDIREGNKYLFAVETYENSYPSLLNPDQAVFNLDTETEGTEHRGITYSQILEAVSKGPMEEYL